MCPYESTSLYISRVLHYYVFVILRDSMFSLAHVQGSHRVWKTGKTGKEIMVREKSGNFILGQKYEYVHM